MRWTSHTALLASKPGARLLLASVAMVVCAQLFVGGCDSETPTDPTDSPKPTPTLDWETLATPATPPPEGNSAAPPPEDTSSTPPPEDTSSTPPPEDTSGTPPPGGDSGRSWSKSGVTVTIVADRWGPGTCHALASGRQCRTFRIENGSAATIYSLLAIFNAPEPGCSAWGPDGATNDPNMIDGPTSIGSGETATVKYCVTMNEKKCDRIQVDDSWGPFGVFVVGDVFDFGRPCPAPSPAPTATPPVPEVAPIPPLGPALTPTTT